MIKRLFVLRVGDYRPDLCRFTIPTIKKYAKKIGAEYVEITEREFGARYNWDPTLNDNLGGEVLKNPLPVTLEKLQVYNLGRDSDWNILVDADVMIHPTMPDVTKFLSPVAVSSAFAFDASAMFRPNRFFERDGRNIGIVANFVVSTSHTHDVWDYTQAIYPDDLETLPLSTWTKREFIIDEYVLSSNLAKFGLRHSGILPMPHLEQMIVHLGNEESTPEQRLEAALKAERLFNEWGFTCAQP